MRLPLRRSILCEANDDSDCAGPAARQPMAWAITPWRLPARCAANLDWTPGLWWGIRRGRGPRKWTGFKVRKVAARSAEGLEETLLEAARGGEPRVLLQLSGYGFSGRGCPWWLMQGLRRWRAKQKDARLVTMFHELYAEAPPWKTTLLGESGAADGGEGHRAELGRCGDEHTAVPGPAGAIRSLQAGKRGGAGGPVQCGRAAGAGGTGTRARSMVVFGQPGSRKRTYATQMAALQRACELLGISEVHDVGESFDGIPERVGDCRVRRHGVLSGADLSLLLAECVAGFVDLSAGFFSQVRSVCRLLRAPDDPCASGHARRPAAGRRWHRGWSSLLERCRKTRRRSGCRACASHCRRSVELVSGPLCKESCASVCRRAAGLEGKRMPEPNI